MENEQTQDTSSEEEFQQWLTEEISAVFKLIEQRGNLPAQCGYILICAMTALIQKNTTSVEEYQQNITLKSLMALGGEIRPHAQEQWKASAAAPAANPTPKYLN